MCGLRCAMLKQYETGKRFRVFELCVPEFQSILFRLSLEIPYQCSACHTFLFQRVSSNQPVQWHKIPVCVNAIDN